VSHPDSWAALQGFQLRLWPTEESSQDGDVEPLFSVPVNKDTELVAGMGEGSSQLTLRSERTGGPEVELTLPSAEEAGVWRRALETSITASQLWLRAGEHEMTILTPSARLSGVSQRPRLRSLYEHVSLKDDAASPDLPPPPPPRPRAQSTSGLASFIRWGSLRSRRKLNS